MRVLRFTETLAAASDKLRAVLSRVQLQQIVMERGETLLNVLDLEMGAPRQLRLDRVLAARVLAEERSRPRRGD